MKSHFSINRGVTAACAVAGVSTLLNGTSRAQTFIAADYATNSTYDTGWSAGQNGGYGFGPWSMNFTEATSPNEHAIDRTSPFDPFGVAWTLYNPEGVTPGQVSPGQCDNPPTGTDISRAGRAIPNGGLQVGQTFSTVIANPSDRRFFRGYTIVLSTGSDNIQYGGFGQQVAVGTFEYNNSNGKWYVGGGGDTGIFDTDTTTNGMRIDITLTSTTTFHVGMTPLGDLSIAYSADGTLENKGLTEQGSVNWLTYQFYNTDSNFHPSLAPCGPDRTDFYIKSMTVASALNIQKVGANVQITWPTGTLLEADEVTGPYNPNPNTSPYTFVPSGTKKFFRLQFQ